MIGELEEGGSGVQGHPQLHSKSEANVSYMGASIQQQQQKGRRDSSVVRNIIPAKGMDLIPSTSYTVSHHLIPGSGDLISSSGLCEQPGVCALCTSEHAQEKLRGGASPQNGGASKIKIRAGWGSVCCIVNVGLISSSPKRWISAVLT